MKAAVLRDGTMVVEELPDLAPGPKQVLVEPIACGICGTDLHIVRHAHDVVATAKAAGGRHAMGGFDPDKDLIMGHELSARVLEVGSDVYGIEVDGIYTAKPYLRLADGDYATPGYSNDYPGGYSNQMLLSPQSLLAVPNGLDPLVASLTEPMAVGIHAVNESSISKGQVALVVGVGPAGLAIVAALAARGYGPIVASDFSPKRRATADALGADVVVDPAVADPFDAWREHGDGVTPPVIFEAVGVPGVIDSLMAQAPARSEIVVAGVCLPPDNFRPTLGIYKELRLTFVLGWTNDEFAESLHDLAEGRIDGEAVITGEVGIDAIPQAFADLADPENHVKVLVRPDL